MKNFKKITYTVIGMALISLFAASYSFAEAPYSGNNGELRGLCFYDSTQPSNTGDLYMRGK